MLVLQACGDDLLLHFPFDDHFDDVTCHHAQGFPYGEGTVTLVNDPDRGMVAHFDGSSRIEVHGLDTSVWNDLPRNMRTCDSLYQFKRLLKTYLFKRAFHSWTLTDVLNFLDLLICLFFWAAFSTFTFIIIYYVLLL